MPIKLNRDKIISVSVNFLRQAVPSLEIVYLFGSQATGQATKQSDVDLAFLTFDKLNNVKRWEIQQELAKRLDSDIDLVDLNASSTVMQLQVVSKGERIFARNQKEAEYYEDKVHFLYLDLCELRQPIINNINESGSIYG